MRDLPGQRARHHGAALPPHVSGRALAAPCCAARVDGLWAAVHACAGSCTWLCCQHMQQCVSQPCLPPCRCVCRECVQELLPSAARPRHHLSHRTTCCHMCAPQVHVPRVRAGAAQADKQVPHLPQPGGEPAAHQDVQGAHCLCRCCNLLFCYWRVCANVADQEESLLLHS